MIKIEMARGDYKKLKFQIKSNGTVLTTDFDDIYITFKKNYNTTEILFQKLLSSVDITKDEDYYYHFAINPSDTNKLKYGTYVFDIQVYKASQIKKTVLGQLTIANEVTFAFNEEEGGVE